MVQEGCPRWARWCRSKGCSSTRSPRQHWSPELCARIASSSFVKSEHFATTEEPRGAKIARLLLFSLFGDNEFPGSNRYLLTRGQRLAGQEIGSGGTGVGDRRRGARIVKIIMQLAAIRAD